jgi:DNA polymerase-1
VGFFFLKEPTPKSSQKPSNKGLLGPRSAKASAGLLNRLGCKACPLANCDAQTPKMVPTLAPHTEIYFLAEAPGRDEDEHSGEPLTGPSGALLRSCIPRSARAICSYDNIVNCKPPNNRTPVWQEIECCRPRRQHWIAETKPKLVVGLGVVPMHAILGSTDIQGMRGRLFAVNIGGHACWFMPTYDPSFLIKNARNRERPLNSMLGHCFKMDIKRAFDLVGDLDVPTIYTDKTVRAGITSYYGSHQIKELRRHLDTLSKEPLLCVDLETKGLRPFSANSAIMSIALSTNDLNIAIAMDHPESKWSKDESAEIKQALYRILVGKGIKVAHNAPFEIEWLAWWLGRDIVNHTAWEDTQMQAHFLDERRGKQMGGDDERRMGYQKLDFLIKQHFGLAYKSLFKLNKKDMSKSPLTEVLLYNAVDTKFTLQLWIRQTQLLKRSGLHDAYREALPRQTSCALMQSIGVPVDQTEVKACQDYLGAHLDDAERDISTEALRIGVGDFNPHSSTDVLHLFRDKLGFKEVEIEEGEKTRYSVDKNVLERIDHPLAKLIARLRNANKLKSTYVDPFEQGTGAFIYPDGLIHPNFNTTFTETGRTSCDEPNMQNFPSRNDSWVRSQIKAPDGHLIVAFDYGQLEGCTAAMCSRDKVLVKAMWEDYDIHMEWAQKAAKRWPDFGEPDKKFRSRIKNKLVFPAIFGAQNKSIAAYLKAPEDVIDDLMAEFWDTFNGLKEWQNALMKTYYTDGYVDSPTGRRHHYPLTKNQVINHPVQSLACDIVCSAMNRLSHDAVTTGKWYLHPILNIHDDLSFIVPDNPEVMTEAIQHIYKTMLTPNYPCVNVPLSVSCSVGQRWYGMEEVGKFWSNKDL